MISDNQYVCYFVVDFKFSRYFQSFQRKQKKHKNKKGVFLLIMVI